MSLSQALSSVAISTSNSASSTSQQSRTVSSSSLTLNSALWGSKLAHKSNSVAVKQHVRSGAVAAPVAMFADEDEEESEEDITAAYEALYGKAFEGLKARRDDDDEEDEQPRGRRGRGGDDGERGGGRRDRAPKDNFEERVVQIRRVTKVVKGGKQMSFRAVVVIGDKQGKVGVGVGKAKEVIAAVQKSATDARRHLVTVPMTKYLTFPHRYE